MIERIIIAGAGGQGIMLLGKILAEAAMREAKQVTWLPSYGPEVRGGTANCTVVISDTEISSPHVEKADTLIIMNSPSWQRFKDRVKPGGLVIINTSLVKAALEENSRLVKHPFTDMAARLGNIKVANMLVLGRFIAEKKIVKLKTVFEAIEAAASCGRGHLIEINKKALEEGVGLK